MVSGEIHFILPLVDNDIRIFVDSLLQPGDDGGCVSMLLLFGKVPSWYSLPCGRPLPSRTLVCKKHLGIRPSGDHSSVNNRPLLKCNGNQVILFDKCFEIKSGLHLAYRVGSPSYDAHYKRYVTVLFSVLTRHILESFQIHMHNLCSAYTENEKNNVCIKTASLVGLPNDYNGEVQLWESECDTNNTRRTYTFVPVSKQGQTDCLPSQFKCSDGSCVAQDRLCYNGIACYPPSCSCKMNGQLVNNAKFCYTACMPGECLCAQSHFQCTCGGCLDMAFVCDGKTHCKDASDEICDIKILAHEMDGTFIETVLGNKTFCLGYLCMSRQCLHVEYVNDLLPDCHGGQAEDEPLFLQMRYEDNRFACQNPIFFPCVPGLSACFPLNKLCLYELDRYGRTSWCKDGVHLGDCSRFNCTNSYKCHKSYCIPFHYVCDGRIDCIHGEEEEHCDEYVCKGLLRCMGTTICVHPTYVCDGINHCPYADDETLCDANACPHNCNCVTYSITCTIDSQSIFPMITSDHFKQIALVDSYMPYGDFHDICNLTNVLFMNISQNHVRDICVSMLVINNCRLLRKLVIFDLSYNDITYLQSFCFKSLTALKVLILAHNPLNAVHNDAFSQSSIPYISIRGTQLISLSRTIFTGFRSLYMLDIREIYLESVDNAIHEIIRHIPYFQFDDPRLCCIFKENGKCKKQLEQAALCRTLLPVRTIGYVTFPVGAVLVIYTSIALIITLRFRYFGHHYKLTIFLISLDATLAMYLTTIGATDLYYKSHFVLIMNQWKRSILCRVMENLTAIATILSSYHCGLHIYLMMLGTTRLTYNTHDAWNKLLIIEIVIIIATVSFTVILSLVNDFTTESQSHVSFLCNVMGDSDMTTMTGKIWAVMLCVSVVASQGCITIAIIKMISHITAMTKEVADITNHAVPSQHRSGVLKILLLFLMTKTVTYLPYPLFLLWGSLSATDPRDIRLCVMINFVILECFSNPAMFVFKPFWVHWRRSRLFTDNSQN